VLKYIVGLIFIALTWAVALVFRGVAPLLWLAVGVTGAVGFGLLAFDLVRMRSAQRASSALENGLGGPAGDIRPINRPRSRPCRPNSTRPCTASSPHAWHSGAVTFSARFPVCHHRAVRGWQDHGAAKLGLAISARQRRKGAGVGGTRNCDWWLSNDAVILDTADAGPHKKMTVRNGSRSLACFARPGRESR